MAKDSSSSYDSEGEDEKYPNNRCLKFGGKPKKSINGFKSIKHVNDLLEEAVDYRS